MQFVLLPIHSQLLCVSKQTLTWKAGREISDPAHLSEGEMDIKPD